MKIGIPKALMYYKYFDLWSNFFNNLGFEVITSCDTNFDIMQNGIKYSIDENCLASKIYMGHVFYLIDKCDYIFVPRYCSYKDGDIACIKFNGLYDICKNTFDNVKFLNFNLDYSTNNGIDSLFNLAQQLGLSKVKVLKAYLNAKKTVKEKNKLKVKLNNMITNLNFKNNNLNIAIVAHPYVYEDKMLGQPVVSYLKSNNVNVIFSDNYDKENIKDGWQNFSKTIYFKNNKELLTGLNQYIAKVDGVIFLSVFSCGPDSIVNDLCVRRIKDKPILNLILDEQYNAGIETRLESFIDILNFKRKADIVG